MNITVMGATGKTGGVVAQKLLAANAKVRALGRSQQHLAPLAKAGAEPFVADATDATALTAAFRGADAVYVMVPPNPTAPDTFAYYDAVMGAVASAITTNGVKRAVYLSSLGAEQPSGTGPIVGLRRGEETLNGLAGLDVLALRPGYFFENFHSSLPLIKQQGINGGATRGDVPVSMIATQDIGEAAAQALLAKDFAGHKVRELLGPREYTMAEVTRIIGEAIGKPDLTYVTFPEDAFVAALVAGGLSANFAGMFAELSRAFNGGLVRSVEGRSPKNTTATTFEQFVPALAAAYRAT